MATASRILSSLFLHKLEKVREENQVLRRLNHIAQIKSNRVPLIRRKRISTRL